MTKNDAVKQAREIALRDQVSMAVVDEGPHADEFAEHDEDGKCYAFCAVEAFSTLYKHAVVVETITPEDASSEKAATVYAVQQFTGSEKYFLTKRSASGTKKILCKFDDDATAEERAEIESALNCHGDLVAVARAVVDFALDNRSINLRGKLREAVTLAQALKQGGAL